MLWRLFEKAPAFFALLTGPDFVFELTNRAYLELVGRTDIIGKPVFEALPEVRGQGFEEILARVYRTGEPFIAHEIPADIIRRTTGSSERIYVDLVYYPFAGDDGRTRGIIAYGSDVTSSVLSRKRAEDNAEELSSQVEEAQVLTEELEASNEELQRVNKQLKSARDAAQQAERRITEMLDNIHDSVSILGRDWRWEYMNPAAQTRMRESGRDPDAMIGKVLWEEFPDLAGTKFETETKRAAAENTVVQYEEYYAGRNKWYEVLIVPAEHTITTFSRDVTERIRVAEELRNSEDQFRTALNAIPTLAWIAKADGWIFWYNKRWYDYTGTTPEEMEGWGWQSVHDPDMLPAVLERWQHSIATGAPFDMSFPLKSASGEFRWFLTRVSPLRDSRGNIQRWFGTNTDVHIEREAAEAAKAANKAKADFLAAMSHETRQPINATLGFLQVIDMETYGPVSAEQRIALQRIRSNQEQLLSVLNDVLSFARLDAGTLDLQHDLVQCDELINALPALVEPQIAAKNLKFNVSACSDKLRIEGDRNRILQILTNLVTNAIRATMPGGVISISAEAEGNTVGIRVTDTGVGIPEEKLEAIFHPFVQLGRALSQPREGVGLGLAISRDFARRMGGDITVTSREGLGSTFLLTLPRAD